MLISWNKHKMYNGIKLILTSVPLLYFNITSSFSCWTRKEIRVFLEGEWRGWSAVLFGVGCLEQNLEFFLNFLHTFLACHDELSLLNKKFNFSNLSKLLWLILNWQILEKSLSSNITAIKNVITTWNRADECK